MKWLAILCVVLAGCDYVERPRRGIPEHFEAQTLTGEPIDRDWFKGKPWVVNLWVPG